MQIDTFESYYRQCYGPVRAIALAFGFRNGAVDDIVQEAFVRAWEKRDKLKEQAAFPGWVKTIARNLCLDQCRPKREVLSIVGTDATDEENPSHTPVAPDPAEKLDWEISLELLDELIATYPKEPRASIARLFYKENQSVKEIAAALKLGQNTVLSHLRRFRLAVSQTMLTLVQERGLEIS